MNRIKNTRETLPYALYLMFALLAVPLLGLGLYQVHLKPGLQLIPLETPLD